MGFGEVTISEAWVWVVAFCGGLMAVVKVVEYIAKHMGKGDINKKLDTHSKQLDSDLKRIKSLEDGQIIVMQTLLALTQHAINGNNVDALRKSRDDLQQYLIHR